MQLPDFYEATDVELEIWIRGLVDGEIEEGFELDYKATLKLDTPSAKRELAKDVAAFANTFGGVLLVGVEENKEANKPGRPKSDYGIEQLPRLSELVHDIIANAAKPRL